MFTIDTDTFFRIEKRNLKNISKYIVRKVTKKSGKKSFKICYKIEVRINVHKIYSERKFLTTADKFLGSIRFKQIFIFNT